eukprot:scaffold4727_cov38-Phaeocystis_antarctica.AAC.1
MERSTWHRRYHTLNQVHALGQVTSPTRVLRCCVYPAGRRSPERPELVLRCSGRLAPPRQGPGQLCSRWAASGKLREARKRRFARGNKTPTDDGNYCAITIVGHVATVSPRV